MKKIAMILIGALLCTSLVACGKQAQTEDEAAIDAAEEMLAGGWQANKEDTTVIPDNVQAAFDKAMEGLVGVSYEPVAYLGSQVVAGTNYALLCKGTTVTAEPKTSYYKVVIYEDLSGNCEVLSIDEVSVGQ